MNRIPDFYAEGTTVYWTIPGLRQQVQGVSLGRGDLLEPKTLVQLDNPLATRGSRGPVAIYTDKLSLTKN